jgi:hypothetical protein
MPELREIVAKAIWDARRAAHGHWPDNGEWEQQVEMVRDWVLAEADAAIAAIREHS